MASSTTKSWRLATFNLTPRLSVTVAALWWGSLSVIGFLVVPMLFAHLPSPAIAGGMAAKLFAAQTWVSGVCGLALLVLLRRISSATDEPVAAIVMMLILAGMLLAFMAEFAVAPRIVTRENLRLWHSVGSVMYLLQWVCAAATFWKLTGLGQRLSGPARHQV